jgi:hypothetical protein
MHAHFAPVRHTMPGSGSLVWFFGASRLGSQTFDVQILRDTRLPQGRYHGGPASQLGIGQQYRGTGNP